MKNKLFSVLLSITLMLTCLTFIGCGEQFIIEKDYQLLGMQVVVDNTEIEGYYQYAPGTYVTNLSGNIKLIDCIVSVKKDQLKLFWDDGSGVKATYIFDIISDINDYPTYTYTNYIAAYNDIPIQDMEEADIVEAEIIDHVRSMMAFDIALNQGETRIQIITQSTSLTAAINIVNVESKQLIFKSELYGINAEA